MTAAITSRKLTSLLNYSNALEGKPCRLWQWPTDTRHGLCRGSCPCIVQGGEPGPGWRDLQYRRAQPEEPTSWKPLASPLEEAARSPAAWLFTATDDHVRIARVTTCAMRLMPARSSVSWSGAREAFRQVLRKTVQRYRVIRPVPPLQDGSYQRERLGSISMKESFWLAAPAHLPQLHHPLLHLFQISAHRSITSR